MTALTDSTPHIKDVLQVADRSGINPKQVELTNNGLTKRYLTTAEETHHIDDLRKIVELTERITVLESQRHPAA